MICSIAATFSNFHLYRTIFDISHTCCPAGRPPAAASCSVPLLLPAACLLLPACCACVAACCCLRCCLPPCLLRLCLPPACCAVRRAPARRPPSREQAPGAWRWQSAPQLRPAAPPLRDLHPCACRPATPPPPLMPAAARVAGSGFRNWGLRLGDRREGGARKQEGRSGPGREGGARHA